jgi:hypothetical protein
MERGGGGRVFTPVTKDRDPHQAALETAQPVEDKGRKSDGIPN